jgi:hypothetical protein
MARTIYYVAALKLMLGIVIAVGVLIFVAEFFS